MLSPLSNDEILRYSRHLLIPEIGLEGQRKLKTSSALIIGTGGLGSPVCLYLAAAGVGRLGIVDYDVVEMTNLHRQVLHNSSEVGNRKVESARARMVEINPYIQVDVYDEPFSSDNAVAISGPYQVIIDGSDNFPTRYLTNDLCVMTGKTNVYGAVFRFDGQASVFDARIGPCYRCLFPEPPPPGMVPSCADAGVLGVLPGTIGTIQATEAIKTLLGIGSSLAGRLLLYNALDMTFDSVELKKNPDCLVCGSNPKITSLIDYDEFCGVPGLKENNNPIMDPWEIEALTLKERIQQGDVLQLIDVREPHELHISQLKNAINIPLGDLAGILSQIDSTNEIILICKSGTRSRRALELLISAGFKRVKHLKGGINAWAREIDPSLPVY